jgi:hypothetical protein
MTMAQGGISGSTNVVTLGTADDKTDQIMIEDWEFIQNLERLKKLRSFLQQEAVYIHPEDSTALSFGKLNLLQGGYPGRAPTQEEWSALEFHTQTLFRLLTDPLRRRFLMGDIPPLLSKLPALLMFVALLALIGAAVVPSFFGIGASGAITLPFYLVWLTSLGALGSVAFIGMNALSVQQDVTFDLNNPRLMMLRIVLGALFGLVLTLPFGFQGFMVFIAGIVHGSGGSPTLPAELAASPKISITTQAMLLLLPFVLGFSTSLVITVLNRLVDAIQAFFGRTGTSERAQTDAAPSKSPFSGKSTSRPGDQTKENHSNKAGGFHAQNDTPTDFKFRPSATISRMKKLFLLILLLNALSYHAIRSHSRPPPKNRARG